MVLAGVCGSAAITAFAFLILPVFFQDRRIALRPIAADQFLTAPHASTVSTRMAGERKALNAQALLSRSVA